MTRDYNKLKVFQLADLVLEISGPSPGHPRVCRPLVDRYGQLIRALQASLRLSGARSLQPEVCSLYSESQPDRT